MDSLANKNIKITSSTVKNYKPRIQNKKTQIRGIHTSNLINKNISSLNHFTPLKNDIINPNQFATMDIETIYIIINKSPLLFLYIYPIKVVKSLY